MWQELLAPVNVFSRPGIPEPRIPSLRVWLYESMTDLNVKPRSTECHWHLGVYSVSSWLSTLDVDSELNISLEPVTSLPWAESNNNTRRSDIEYWLLESHCTGQLFLTVLDTGELIGVSSEFCSLLPTSLCTERSSHCPNVTGGSTSCVVTPGVSRGCSGDVCKFLLRFLLSTSACSALPPPAHTRDSQPGRGARTLHWEIRLGILDDFNLLSPLMTDSNTILHNHTVNTSNEAV